jgi:hypothetical protein
MAGSPVSSFQPCGHDMVQSEDMTNRPAIDLRERDISILRGLFECRVMSAIHIAALYFEGKPEAAKKRLHLLKSAGYIAERPRRPSEPAILFLTRRAFEALSDAGVLRDYPDLAWTHLEKRARVGDLTLRHELSVMDVKTAMTVAVSRVKNLQLPEFCTWPLLFQFRACRSDGTEVTVKPDGFLRLWQVEEGERYEHALFLEVDRSNESQEVLAEKVAGYADFYRSGGFAVRHGASRSDYASYPFRVLMVFPTAERRNNAAARLLANNPPIRTLCWLTTMTEAVEDPLGAIWVRPADYAAATEGTPYAVDGRGVTSTYRRQTEREKVVEEGVKKRGILGK